MKDEIGSKRTKKPWPTKEAMEQVYEKNLWGGQTEFFSGEGSHLQHIVDPYIKAVTAFLTSFNNPLSVCDLGCGDFNIGRQLVEHTKKYFAVDIVSDLIERNKQTFQAEHLEFQCLDIAADDLPPADCAIVRQVLQHLSNAEVQRIVNKLSQYKYIIITEHVPNGTFTPNKDIISGQGTRLKKQSGLDLLASPFNLKVREEKQLLSLSLNNAEEVINTALYVMR